MTMRGLNDQCKGSRLLLLSFVLRLFRKFVPIILAIVLDNFLFNQQMVANAISSLVKLSLEAGSTLCTSASLES